MSVQGRTGSFGLSKPALFVILLVAMLLAGITFFMLPALDALSAKPPEVLEYHPVKTVAMVPQRPPKPVAEEPVKPQREPVSVTAPRPRPQLEMPKTSLPRPRLSLRTSFNLPLPAPDLTMDFQVAQEVSPLPAQVESAPSSLEPHGVRPTFEGDEVDSLPEAISRPQPQFPYRAKIRGIRGKVVVEFVVDEEGRVADAAILSAEPSGYFEETTLTTLRKWRFKPALKESRPVPTRMRTTIDFQLVSP